MDKDQLWSGDWSVILISNNGDACPIAYERDFYLTVAEPVTTTFTPTVSLTASMYFEPSLTSSELLISPQSSHQSRILHRSLQQQIL